VLDLWHLDMNTDLGLLWVLDLEVLFGFWILDLHLDSKWFMDSEFKLDFKWDSGFIYGSRLYCGFSIWNWILISSLDFIWGLGLD